MASRWAEQLPIVTMGRGLNPKRVTIVLPYYQNAAFFREQVQHWWHECPPEYRSFINAIVVDDGSPEPAMMPAAVPFTLRLFRITQDIPWNWLAARNIGAHHAAEGWIVLTDMDHVITSATFQALVDGAHDPSVVYAFSRLEHTGAAIPPHSASFFLTQELFWRIGGYDETLSGHYGTDGEFRRRIVTVAQIQVLSDVLIRYENVGDSSTTRYRRKLPEDAAAVSALVKARRSDWRPKTLSFPYQEVPC